MNILCLWVNKTVLIPDTKSRKRSIEKKINYRSSCADMHTKDLNSRDYASNTSIPFDWSSFEKFSDISPSEIPSWITRDIITDIVIDRNNGGYGRENNRNRGWSATTRAPCVHLSRINAVYVRSQRKQPAYIVNHEFVVINYAFRPITSSPGFYWLFPLALSYRLFRFVPLRNFRNSRSWDWSLQEIRASVKLLFYFFD